jgi:hypothetical protein
MLVGKVPCRPGCGKKIVRGAERVGAVSAVAGPRPRLSGRGRGERTIPLRFPRPLSTREIAAWIACLIIAAALIALSAVYLVNSDLTADILDPAKRLENAVSLASEHVEDVALPTAKPAENAGPPAAEHAALPVAEPAENEPLAAKPAGDALSPAAPAENAEPLAAKTVENTARPAATLPSSAEDPRFASAAEMPAQQQQFLSVISDFAQKYATALNDMTKNALRQQRARAICAIINDLVVTNWIGTVNTPPADEGRGVLTVSLDKRSTIGFWDKLKSRTALHNANIQLSPGQIVVFSGRFSRAKGDCITARSPTLREAMTQPNWLMRFSVIKTAEKAVPAAVKPGENDVQPAATMQLGAAHPRIPSAAEMPKQQQQFLSIIGDFAQKYETARNDMAKDALRQQKALRQQRARALCGIMNDLTVTNWIGTLYGTDQGRGVVAVSLDKRSKIGTWDKFKPRTALHDASIQLIPGQTIVFSGKFFRAKGDCITARSSTLREAMTQPNWIMQFSSINPAENAVRAPAKPAENAAWPAAKHPENDAPPDAKPRENASPPSAKPADNDVPRGTERAEDAAPPVVKPAEDAALPAAKAADNDVPAGTDHAEDAASPAAKPGEDAALSPAKPAENDVPRTARAEDAAPPAAKSSEGAALPAARAGENDVPPATERVEAAAPPAARAGENEVSPATERAEDAAPRAAKTEDDAALSAAKPTENDVLPATERAEKAAPRVAKAAEEAALPTAMAARNNVPPATERLEDAAPPAGKPAQRAAVPVAKPKENNDVRPDATMKLGADLYEEDPKPKGKLYPGSVDWHTEQVASAAGEPPDLAALADIEIPQLKLKVMLSLRHNSDATKPPSPRFEIHFTVPPDFAHQGIDSIPGILMSGVIPLALSAVKVADNSFELDLGRLGLDRNLQLLKERTWFYVPLVYNDGTRAILSVKKDALGELAFRDAHLIPER